MKRVFCVLALALPAFAGWVLDGVSPAYVDAASVAPSGVHDFGVASNIVVGGQASCYLAAPTNDWTLAVGSGVPRYPFQIRVESTNGVTHGAALVNDNGWTVGSGTNILYFFPAASGPTNWLYWGVAR